MEMHDKIFSETARPKACIFGMQQCHVELYINPADHATGDKYGPTLGVIIALKQNGGLEDKQFRQELFC